MQVCSAYTNCTWEGAKCQATHHSHTRFTVTGDGRMNETQRSEAQPERKFPSHQSFPKTTSSGSGLQDESKGNGCGRGECYIELNRLTAAVS